MPGMRFWSTVFVVSLATACGGGAAAPAGGASSGNSTPRSVQVIEAVESKLERTIAVAKRTGGINVNLGEGEVSRTLTVKECGDGVAAGVRPRDHQRSEKDCQAKETGGTQPWHHCPIASLPN